VFFFLSFQNSVSILHSSLPSILSSNFAALFLALPLNLGIPLALFPLPHLFLPSPDLCPVHQYALYHALIFVDHTRIKKEVVTFLLPVTLVLVNKNMKLVLVTLTVLKNVKVDLHFLPSELCGYTSKIKQEVSTRVT
jgi:hypothetical protein